jgi:hypothetical protein
MEPGLNQAVADQWISEKWLTEHKNQVEDSIFLHISERHPTIPDEVSGITLRRVTVLNDVSEKNQNAVDSTEQELSEVFKNVARRILGDRTNSLSLDISVTFMNLKLSSSDMVITAVSALPLAALCYGSVLSICPGTSTHYVVLDATISCSDPAIHLRGIGGATLVASAVMLADSPYPDINGSLETNTKAMAAAVADLSEKLIPHLITRHDYTNDCDRGDP